MDVLTIQEKIRLIKQLREEIKNDSTPQITDATLIPQLHHHFAEICRNRGQNTATRRNKYLFIASIVMLYSPMSFVGKRIPKGVRTPLAKIMGYNSSEAISVAVRRVVSDYRIYSKFKAEVDTLCRTLSLKIH